MVQGASGGLGLGFVRHLLKRPDVERVFAGARSPESNPQLQAILREAGGRLQLHRCDITDEASIANWAAEVKGRTDRLDFIANVSGILHDAEGLGPERRIEHADPAQLQKVFAVNAFGPLLVAKHFHPFIHHGERAVIAHLSARVGSIGDNRLGGWYAYRASKAALNQFVRTMAVELKRRNKNAICVAVHPGTVDTPLTKPFQKSAKVLFTPDESVHKMMAVLSELTPAATGGFFAYDGSTIEW